MLFISLLFYEYQTFNTKLTIITTTAIVTKCLFSKISSSGNGGGILISNSGSTAEISYSLFNDISTTNSGGSFNLNCNRITIRFCCLINTRATEASAGFLASSNSDSYQLVIRLCSPKSNPSYNVPYCYNFGIQTLNNVNSTECIATHHSGIHHYGTSNLVSKFINLINHVSTQFVYGFNAVTGSINILYANLIGNYASVGLFYISAGISNVNFTCFYFKSNTGSLTSSSTSYTGTAFFYKCWFDLSNPVMGLFAGPTLSCIMGASDEPIRIEFVQEQQCVQGFFSRTMLHNTHKKHIYAAFFYCTLA